MQAFPLTVGPPYANSDKSRSSLVCRIETSLPSVLLRLKRCQLDACCAYSHPQSVCWFSLDPQEGVSFCWASSVQIWDLRICRKAVPWWSHLCASELVQQLGLLSSKLSLVDFRCKQLHCLSEIFSPWFPCSSKDPFGVSRKCHDSRPIRLQRLVSMFLSEMCESNQIV